MATAIDRQRRCSIVRTVPHHPEGDRIPVAFSAFPPTPVTATSQRRRRRRHTHRVARRESGAAPARGQPAHRVAAASYTATSARSPSRSAMIRHASHASS